VFWFAAGFSGQEHRKEGRQECDEEGHQGHQEEGHQGEQEGQEVTKFRCDAWFQENPMGLEKAKTCPRTWLLHNTVHQPPNISHKLRQ
jgi:hypothetical protein